MTMVDSDWLEAALKKQEYEKRIIKILNFTSVPATAKGESYLSEVHKAKATVLLGSGRKADVPLVVKVTPDESKVNGLVSEMGLFKNEIKVYTNVLREMEFLMSEFGDTRENLWSDCVGFKAYSCLIFEDLTSQNFSQANRSNCLDLNHALLVVTGLARFHAMSRILFDRGLISPSDFEPYQFMAVKKNLEKVFQNPLFTMAKEVINWGGEWVGIGNKLKSTVLWDTIEKIYQVDESRFNVLNHGDCWTCNLFFRYDDSSKLPISMKFVDFQISYYNSPAWDLTYLMSTSLKPALRREKEHQILQTYFEVLNSSLNLFGYEGKRISLEELRAEVKRVWFYRVPLITLSHPVMTSDIKDSYDLGVALGDENSEHAINPILFKGERGDDFRKSVGPDIKHFIEMGLI